MDRFVLQGLVRQFEPKLMGSRIKSVWQRPDGIALRGRNKENSWQLEIGVRVQAPVFALLESSRRTEPDGPRSKPPGASIGFRRKLEGGRVAGIRVSPIDRIVRLDLERRRASGRRDELALVIEWIGPLSAVYLVGASEETAERTTGSSVENVVDSFALGTPRLGRGERYQPPPAPSGPSGPSDHDSELPSDGKDLIARLGSPETLTVTRLRQAGLPPPLDKEFLHRVEHDRDSVEHAYEEIVSELAESRARLYLRRKRELGNERQGQLAMSRVSAFSLHHLGDAFESISVDDFNEAMIRALEIEALWSDARRLYARTRKWLRSQHKRLDRLRKKLLRERDEGEEPLTLRRWGELLLAGQHQAELTPADTDGRRFASVPDAYDLEAKPVRIPIDGRYGLLRNAERYFSLASKTERRRDRLRGRLVELSQQIDYLESSLLSLSQLDEPEELEMFDRELRSNEDYRRWASGPTGGALAEKKTASKHKQAKRLPPREYTTQSGKTILAGRSARSNEALSFEIANSTDLWFHTLGIPGAHVLLRLSSNETANDEDRIEAAGVAAYFSPARESSYVEVMMSEPRHLRKIKGAPEGTVRVESFTSLRVKPALPAKREGKS